MPFSVLLGRPVSGLPSPDGVPEPPEPTEPPLAPLLLLLLLLLAGGTAFSDGAGALYDDRGADESLEGGTLLPLWLASL